MNAESSHRHDFDTAALGIAARIVEDAWAEVARGPYVQVRMGVVPTHLPDLSFAEAERRSAVGHSLLKRLDAIDFSLLPHELALSLRLVRFRARTWAREADWYWLVADPRGIGSFSIFLPTTYCAGYLLSFAQEQLASFAFRTAGDTDRYLALVSDYAGMIDQIAARTAGQAKRGIYMAHAQVPLSRALLSAFRSSARATIGVRLDRLGARTPALFRQELQERIASLVEPAFDRALAVLSDDYIQKAPSTVGIGQYFGGEAIYHELVKLHTTLDLTPDQVHALGLERVAQIEESMRQVKADLASDPTAFDMASRDERAWRADTVDEVSAMFRRYIDRMQPMLRNCFATLPKASYGVEPLPGMLQESMSFGFYDAPRGNRNRGIYFFNPSNLTKQPLFHVAALTYHELMPGHHLQLASQQENPRLHPLRTHSFVNAYIEGWAEYAATLVGEMGLYEQPQERYGRLMMDAFLTSRLVVDTGMNAHGWSLERAREYMRRHSIVSEAEIRMESVRYGERPGQVLAYKLGDAQILGLRNLMRTRLGARFDLKAFHAAVLDPGALPLGDLEWHVRCVTEQLASNCAGGGHHEAGP